MKHSYVSIDRVFSKIGRELTDDFSERDIIEQVGEALEGIGTASLYEDYVAFIEVKDFQCPIPKWCHGINQIAKDNRWKGKKSNMFCPQKIIASVVQEPTVDVPIALDCKGTPIHDYDLAFYRPFLDISIPNEIFSCSSSYRQHYTPVRLKEHTFFGSSVGRKANTSQDEYKIIEGKILRFSFRTGFVAVSYSKQLLDKKTGYPLVPDAFSHLEAITAYIAMKKFKKEFYAGRQGAEGRMNKAESDWQWYCGQASNNDKMPHGIDEYQNLLDQRQRLIPNNRQYFSFFGNLAAPQDGLWGGYDRGEYEDIDLMDEDNELLEAQSCDVVPSNKVINVTNTTVENHYNTGGGNGGGTGNAKNPIVGVAGHNGADDPIVGLSYYQNNKLIGLSSKLLILLNGQPMESYGINKGFDFSSGLGRIDFPEGFEWVAEWTIRIELNQ